MRLMQVSTAVSNLTVSHAMLNLKLNDRITFETATHTVDLTIRTMKIDLEPGALVDAGWRELSFV